MKNSRKIINTVLTLAFATLAFFLFCVSSSAINEIEDNDSKNTATKVPVNETVYCAYDSFYYKEEDWFRFTVPADGTISITLNHDYYDRIAHSYFSVMLDVEDDVFVHNFDFRWDAETQTSERIGLPAGTYLLFTSESADKEDIQYNFTINYTKTDSFEKELNGSLKSANTVPVNTEIGGYTSARDVDYFKFTIPSDGAVSITFNQPYDQDDMTKYVSLFSYDRTEETEYESFSFGSASETQTTARIGLAAGEYYCKIGENDSFISLGKSFEYSFKVNFEPSEYWEKEKNDNIKTATPVSIGEAFNGSVSSFDTDYYEFTVTEAGPVTVEMTHMYTNSSSGIEITVSSYDGTFQKELGCYGGSMTSETIRSEGLDLPAGTYLLNIKTDFYYLHEYSLKVFRSASAPAEDAGEAVNMDFDADEDFDGGEGSIYENTSDNEPESAQKKNTVLIILLGGILISVIAAAAILFVINEKKRRY